MLRLSLLCCVLVVLAGCTTASLPATQPSKGQHQCPAAELSQEDLRSAAQALVERIRTGRAMAGAQGTIVRVSEPVQTAQVPPSYVTTLSEMITGDLAASGFRIIEGSPDAVASEAARLASANPGWADLTLTLRYTTQAEKEGNRCSWMHYFNCKLSDSQSKQLVLNAQTRVIKLHTP